METADLYDVYRNKLGKTIERGQKTPEGCYKMIIHCVIFNETGDKMLIQKRVATKSKWPGFWDLSCGGSSVAGEESFETATREVNEELGLKIDFSKINPSLTIQTTKIFDDVYILQKDVDINSLKLQDIEVEKVKWATKEEIFKMLDEGDFIPYREEYISFLFAIKGSRDCITRTCSM